jgi:carbon storage regulator
MLVLQRRVGQGLRIGDAIEIVVLEVSGDSVRLGIDAPREIRVLRHELLEELGRENRRAAEATAEPSLAPLLGALRSKT